MTGVGKLHFSYCRVEGEYKGEKIEERKPNSKYMYLLSILLSSSLKVVKLYKVIVTMCCFACNIYGCNMYNNNTNNGQ